MTQLTYEDGRLDVAEIWQDLVMQFNNEKLSTEVFDELYTYLQQFYLLKKHAPIVSKAMGKDDLSKKKYYANYVRRFKGEGIFDYFKHGDAFYDMERPCVIQKGEVAEEDFARLFFLRLQGLQKDVDALALFMSYQFSVNFKQDQGAFDEFLTSLKERHPLPKAMNVGLRWWKATAAAFLLRDQAKENAERFKIDETEESALPAALRTVPEAEKVPDWVMHPDDGSNIEPVYERKKPVPISGDWTRKEILDFFAFLWQPHGKRGGYLTQRQVEWMFRNGIQIPSRPLKEKYKLRTSTRDYPKKEVEYFIWAFIQEYNIKAKLEILVFFGCYIKDFESALTKKGLANMNSNITGEEPKKHFFKLEDYMPKRLQKPVSPKRLARK